MCCANFALLMLTLLVNLYPPSTRVSLPNVLCGATLGVAAGRLRFTMSSPWQHAEKSSCLPFRQHPGGEKINRPRIQCPCGRRSQCWPWPLPLTIPVVIKHPCPPLHLSKYIYSSAALYSIIENFIYILLFRHYISDTINSFPFVF